MKSFSVKRIASGVMAALTLAGALRAWPALEIRAAEAMTYAGTPITEHVGGYDHYERTLVTHAYDFSMDRIGHYATDPALGLGNRAAAEIVDGHLTVKEGMKFSFGSAVCLGDDYGLEEGYLSFDLQLTGGKTFLGLRTSRKAATPDDRGIWFVFDGSETLYITEPECALLAKVPMPVSVAEVQTFEVHDALDTITLSCGGKTLASVQYTKEGYLAVCDGTGTVVKSTDKSKIYETGYFQLYMDQLDGYIDNVVFTNVEMSRPIPESDELRLIDYATWTATDALDRTVADNAKAGTPKDNRYVGVFYFLCWVGAGVHVSDNTADYLTYGAGGIKNRIEERSGEAYWAEPYFGYYRNTDTWVYRKHAYMLEAAGVDFIFLDVSNGEVFIPGHMALFDTWLRMRREGIDTPQIVFFNGDTTEFMKSNMQKLFTTVYSDENWEKYEELFFEWDGKPLTFGNMSGVSGEIKDLINEKFTVRGCWAWQDKDNYWNWIQEYIVRGERVRLENGGWGRDEEGKLESLSIAMGHHPVMNKGRSFVNGKQPNNKLGDFEFSSIEQAGLGLGFASQFAGMQTLIDQKVPAEDPFVLMITGWNEWIAGGFTNEKPVTLANTTCKVQYVDQFNPEFSRDGEPMRNKDGYGFGDNYYYQMIDFIRRYKGIAETPVADHQGSINIYDLSSWDGIEMTYRDSLYDTEFRNTVCYDEAYRYINNTGRNDFDYAKVSQDANAFYFLAKTSHDIVIDNDADWMNLYLNTDGDATTGWEGFDYVLNRDRDSFVVTVERFKDNTYETEVVGGAYYYLEGDAMAIRVSKDILGLEGKADRLIFKWADNADVKGDPMAFMDLGDTAPDNRFGFLYLCEDYSTSALPAVRFSEAPATVAQNGAVIEKPDFDLDIEVKESKIDILYDLKNVIAGMYVTDTVLGEQFEHCRGNNNSTAQILKGDDGNFIRINGYSDLRTWTDVEGAYEFSMDIHMVEYGNSAVYIRGEMPGAYAPTNPKNFNVVQVFNYYEWDWYAENGGKIHGASSTAGSGIGLYPGKDSITVRIKRYAEDGLGVASASYTFPYSEAFSPDAKGWFKLRCVDDGKLLSIYFNDILMCSAKLEDPGLVYESDGTGQAYFGKVTLADASGKEVLTVENTRVNSSGSQLALTTRNQTMEFKNIYIAYDAEVAEGAHVGIKLGSGAASVAYTPDARLQKTLNLGKDAPAEAETSAETQLPTAPSDGESEPSSGSQGTELPAKDKGCASALALAVLPMIAAAACLLRRREE